MLAAVVVVVVDMVAVLVVVVFAAMLAVVAMAFVVVVADVKNGGGRGVHIQKGQPFFGSPSKMTYASSLLCRVRHLTDSTCRSKSGRSFSFGPWDSTDSSDPNKRILETPVTDPHNMDSCYRSESHPVSSWRPR